jgi:hypothetical protein
MSLYPPAALLARVSFLADWLASGLRPERQRLIRWDVAGFDQDDAPIN